MEYHVTYPAKMAVLTKCKNYFAICFCVSRVATRSQGEWGCVPLRLRLHLDLTFRTYFQ